MYQECAEREKRIVYLVALPDNNWRFLWHPGNILHALMWEKSCYKSKLEAQIHAELRFSEYLVIFEDLKRLPYPVPVDCIT